MVQGSQLTGRSGSPRGGRLSRRSPHILVCGGSAGLLAFAASVAYSSVPRATRSAKPVPPAMPSAARAFIGKNCAGCHNKTVSSGKLDLTTLPFRPDDRANFDRWAKVADRVSKGEMPPKGAAQPTSAARTNFVANLSKPLLAADEARVRHEGRATWRRLNRYEYENTVRDLLDAPWLQLREMLPEDGLVARFNKVGDALDISHVQMSRYLAAANYALRDALRQPERPATATQRYYVRDQRGFGFRGDQEAERATYPIIGDQADLSAFVSRRGFGFGRRDPEPERQVDPARRELEAVGMVASAYEPLQPKFDRFRAPVSGRYKLRLRAHSFWAGPDSPTRWWRANLKDISKGRTEEPVSLYASSPQGVTSQLRLLGSMDFKPESSVDEIEAVLIKDETIMPDPARLFRSRPPNWHNPLATPEGQPGVAFQWLEVEGPLYDTWPTPGQQLLSGDLPVKATDSGVEIVPKDPDTDGDRLIRAFVKRAFRRPVQDSDVEPFIKLFHAAGEAGASFTDSLLAAYSGVLCSPGFLTLEERPGPLDDYALASRLSYFLWNSEPDATLRALAEKHALHDPKVLSAQADRMLADPRSEQFVDAFLDYWIDLRKTGITSPDEVLYPDYYLDDYLTESSVAETRAFFAELIKANLPARNLVQSRFVMVNDKLAELYGIPDVHGCRIRSVPLPKDSVRGGLLTQASVLKVTANGTTTSPVLRGAWIMERIMGQPVPPPPPSIPAIEPDIRGAKTIREQLDKHRSQVSCAVCHSKIDPPGFALESFDVFGGLRDHYRALGDGEKVPGFGKNGQPFIFHAAQPVDPSGVLPDGRRFKNVVELKQLLLKDERQIARNLARQLVTYSTGAPVGYGDRPKVEAILNRAQADGYGVKSLIHGIIASELFRSK